MLIRLLAVLALALMPVVALADDTPPPTDTPAATDTPAPTSSTSSLLGPTSLGPGSGGSMGDSASLQPAGQSPLQSTTGDATGLTAPNGSALQAPASSDDTLKVIMGDADGTPVQVSDSSNPSLWGWLGLTLLFGIIVTSISLLLRRYPAVTAPLRKVRLPRVRR